MSLIDLVGVGFAYVDSAPLFSEISIGLRPGWTAVVGANGAGKTTLLQLLAGDLEPDTGNIQRVPTGLRLHLCPQRVEALTGEVEAFAASVERGAHRLRGQLELDSQALAGWTRLSPGERKRWQIGAALAAEPGALLLDEPTNHLDLLARGLLETALRRYEGVGVLVSHDRELMAALASHTLRIDQTRARLYSGAYDVAKQSWEAEQEQLQKGHEKLRTEQKKLKRRIHDRRRSWDAAVGRSTTSKRMKNHHDSDARLRLKQKRRRSAENAIGRDIHRLHGTLEKVDARAAKIELTASIGRSLYVNFVPAPVRTLASLEEAVVHAAGDRELALLTDVQIHVSREARIHLRGPNGSGKTTVLTRLMANARIPAEHILYLPQELSEAQSRQLLQETRSLPEAARGQLLSIVAALGVEPGSLLESQQPSPGEARKLALASGLARQVWWLVLDEPTNHLDLPSIERLEEALSDYPGAILLATHDDRFAGCVTNRRLELVDGQVRG